MSKLAKKHDAESILRFQGADSTHRRGINSLAGVFEDSIDAEIACKRLTEEGYKAHTLTDLNTGASVCVVGIHD